MGTHNFQEHYMKNWICQFVLQTENNSINNYPIKKIIKDKKGNCTWLVN